MSLDQMTFDEVLVDTKLAQEYLTKNSSAHSKGYQDHGTTWSYDSYRNKIFYADYTRLPEPELPPIDISDVPEKLFNLAKKIEENSELFCQLEYLIRKIPMSDTKSIDLPLLINNLLHYSNTKSSRQNLSSGRQIIMDDETPLFNLGCVAQTLMNCYPSLVIECCKNTAVVCSLFVDLCHEVGFQEKIRLAILPEISKRYSSLELTVNLKIMHELRSGCICVVTSTADVESAVETFLEATARFPWNIKIILIQECIIERFIKALSWKATLKLSYTGSAVSDCETLSTSVYTYKKKRHLYEYSGSEIDRETGKLLVHEENYTVLIDAYRTTKELIAMVQKSKCFCLSLWCSDLAESNEIAFNVDTNIVWINDYCKFFGPPKSSQALYSIIDVYYHTSLVRHLPKFDDVAKLREAWLKVDINKREEIARNVLKTVPLEVKGKKFDDIDLGVDSFASVSNNTLCIGTDMIPGLLLISDDFGLDIVSFIVKGGGVLYYLRKDHYKGNYAEVLEALKGKGAPIVGLHNYTRFGDFNILTNPVYRTKVVWSHFGTMFAN